MLGNLGSQSTILISIFISFILVPSLLQTCGLAFSYLCFFTVAANARPDGISRHVVRLAVAQASGCIWVGSLEYCNVVCI